MSSEEILCHLSYWLDEHDKRLSEKTSWDKYEESVHYLKHYRQLALEKRLEIWGK